MNPEDISWMDKLVLDEERAMKDGVVNSVGDALNANTVSMAILRDESFATMFSDGRLLYYEGGIYLPNGDKMIGADIEKRMLGDKVTTHFVREVVGHIQRRTYTDGDDFDNDPMIINMANGLYNIETGLSPHTPKYLSLHKSPIEYRPYTTCPNIDQFIADVVPEKYIPTIYEIGGYAMSPKKNLKKSFMFVGEKNSGKSKLLDLLEYLVGKDATSRVSPLTVSRTTFGAAEYYGKSLNLVGDLGNTPIEDTGVLKSVITGERINAQFKYGHGFEYTPNVLCIFATNEVPKIEPFDDAYASRFNLIPFPNLFEPGVNADPDIMDKLTTPEELSGFFNKCMGALIDLTERTTFTNQKTLADSVKAYKHHASPVEQFIDEVCNIDDPNSYVLKDTLYRAYTAWSESGAVRVEPMKVLTMSLAEKGVIIRKTPSDDEGNRPRAYIGVRMKCGLGEY